MVTGACPFAFKPLFAICVCCCHMQVLGHSKTLLVLLGGWAFLGENITIKQFCGILLAISGMIGYGVSSAGCSAPSK